MKIERSEKALIVVGVLLLVVTTLIQFADSKSNDFQNDLLIRQGRLNNLLLYKLEMRVNELNANQMEIFNPKIKVSPMILGLNEQRLEQKQEELRAKYEGGEITSKDFFREQGKFFASEYDLAGKKYQSELREANSKSIAGSSWERWKSVFRFFQICLIIFNLYLVYQRVARDAGGY